MTTELFCDTSYFVALLDPHDDLHLPAKELNNNYRDTLLCTTSAVLIETLNYFSRYNAEIRSAAAQLVAAIREHEQFVIVNTSSELLQASVAFYKERKDKSYSGTDCISMLVMRDRGITSVLSNDRHFLQEKFEILLVDV